MESPYPYENLSLVGHRETTDATSPAIRAVQSKNMWKESEIRPRLRGWGEGGRVGRREGERGKGGERERVARSDQS